MSAPHTTAHTSAQAATAHRLGPVEAIPIGEGRAFTVGRRQVAVFRLRDGTLRATQAQCPHAGGPLADGQLDPTTVICPLHARAYLLHRRHLPRRPTDHPLPSPQRGREHHRPPLTPSLTRTGHSSHISSLDTHLEPLTAGWVRSRVSAPLSPPRGRTGAAQRLGNPNQDLRRSHGGAVTPGRGGRGGNGARPPSAPGAGTPHT